MVHQPKKRMGWEEQTCLCLSLSGQLISQFGRDIMPVHMAQGE